MAKVLTEIAEIIGKAGSDLPSRLYKASKEMVPSESQQTVSIREAVLQALSRNDPSPHPEKSAKESSESPENHRPEISLNQDPPIVVVALSPRRECSLQDGTFSIAVEEDKPEGS